MNRKSVCYAGLLVVVLGSNASAQTRHKKRASTPMIVPASPMERPGTDSTHQFGTEWWARPLPVEEPVNSNPVFTYVDHMPTLNGQDGFIASLTAIHRYMVVPPGAPNGRLFVQFEVDKEGHVRHPWIVKGLRADVDSAVVAATRQLPRFVPGQQAGHAVVVSFTLPVTIAVKKQP